MCSVAADARVVQTTPVLNALSTSSSLSAQDLEAVSGNWREDVREWREARPERPFLGLSCVSYVGAPVLEASGHVLRLRVRHGVPDPPFPRSWSRNEITAYSKGSRRRHREALQRCDWARHSSRWVSITLTLPGRDVEIEMDGRVVHGYREAFLRRCRRLYPRCQYTWKLEFQARGAAHFAVLLGLPSRAILQRPHDFGVLRSWVAQSWFEIVGSGSATHLRAGTQVDEVRDIRRLRTYMVGELVKGRKSKEYQHNVPVGYHHVGRWWGMSRELREPWSYWSLTSEHAYKVRRLLKHMTTSRGYRRHLERSRRKYVSTSAVFLNGSALDVGWRLQGLRQ